MHALAALSVSPWYQRHADDELAAVVGRVDSNPRPRDYEVFRQTFV
jgi:hypothetical protein